MFVICDPNGWTSELWTNRELIQDSIKDLKSLSPLEVEAVEERVRLWAESKKKKWGKEKLEDLDYENTNIKQIKRASPEDSTNSNIISPKIKFKDSRD